MASILADIEDGVISRVQSKWPQGVEQIREFDINSTPESVATPGLYAAAEITSIKKAAVDLWTLGITIHLYVIFKHLKGAEDRRQGAHPIVEALIQLLAGHNLGLDIDELEPLSAPEITDDELRRARKIAFRLDCKTSADIEKQSDDEIVDLLKIVASYMVKPGDDVAEAQTETDLS